MDRRSENAQIFQIYVFVTEIAHRNAKFFAASRRNFSTTWRETYVKTLQIKSKYYVFVAKRVEKFKISRRFAAPAPQEADDHSENTSKIVYILRFRKKQYRLKKI
jgi:hypothetical protein